MSLTNENAAENDLNVNDFKKIHEKAEKIGYADGVDKGSGSVFQLGFDKGYADGLYTGFNLEKYRAFFGIISNSKTSPQHFEKEAAIYESMSLPETIKSEHFQYTKHQNKSVEEISEHQKSYVDKQLQEFEGKLPNTNNLFSLKN